MHLDGRAEQLRVDREMERLVRVPTWIRRLPKVELHAHLSGSVRDNVLQQLLKRERHAALRKRTEALITQPRTMRACFSVFPLLHSLIDDADTLRLCVRHVLADFQEDNAVYLELRTTPRAAAGLNDRSYVDHVFREIAAFHNRNPCGLVCRVLLSVDRSKPVENAWRTARIARELLDLPDSDERARLLVGVELSGNPTMGDWEDFRPVFTHVRENLGLPVSLHFAEVDNEKEALSMLDFQPDRFGHAAILSEKVRKRLLDSRVPVEVCISSNILTGLAVSADEHLSVKFFMPEKHPFTICTDDSGVFRTSVSEELTMFVNELKLSPQKCGELVLAMLEQTFCRDKAVMMRVRENAERKFKESLESVMIE